jgi:hypothetical protein
LVAPLPFPPQIPPIAVIRTQILFRLKLAIAATMSLTFEANRPEEDRLFGIPPF